MKRQITRYLKTLCTLGCIGVFSMCLFTTYAFALPLQQETNNGIYANVLLESKPVQQSITKDSNTNVISVRNSSFAKTMPTYNISTNLRERVNTNTWANNTNKQNITTNLVCQTTLLGTTTESNPVGCIQIDSIIKEYTNVSKFVAAISSASKADVYLYDDITVNNTIEIKDKATITIHLCGHALTGENLSSAQIINVGNIATLTLEGSENNTQESQAHSLNGFDNDGNKKSYKNVCGGVISANQDDYIIGIKISGSNSTVVLNNTTIFGCVFTQGEGAGIYINGKKTILNLNNSHIQHCKAQWGGAIFLRSTADESRIFTDCSSIDHNYAGEYGGGIFCNAEDVTINDKAAYASNEIQKSILSFNKAGIKGGGIYSNGDGLKVKGLLICNNTAAQHGGGAYVYSEDNTFDGCTFTGNTSNKAGSALYDNNDDNTLINCTITNNTSITNNGAVYVCYSVDITLEEYVNISNNTGNNVRLEHKAQKAYIKINPHNFDKNSNVGISIRNPRNYTVCVSSTGGDIPKEIIPCFFIDDKDGQSKTYKIGYDRTWVPFKYLVDKEELAFIEK